MNTDARADAKSAGIKANDARWAAAKRCRGCDGVNYHIDDCPVLLDDIHAASTARAAREATA